MLLADVKRPDHTPMGCVALEVRSGSAEAMYDCVNDKLKLPWPVEMVGETFEVTGTAGTEHGNVSVQLKLDAPKRKPQLIFSLDFRTVLDPNCVVYSTLQSAIVFGDSRNFCLSELLVLSNANDRAVDTHQHFALVLTVALSIVCFLFRRVSLRETPMARDLCDTYVQEPFPESTVSSSESESEYESKSQTESAGTGVSSESPSRDNVLCVPQILPRSKRLMLRRVLTEHGLADSDDDSSGFSIAGDC